MCVYSMLFVCTVSVSTVCSVYTVSVACGVGKRELPVATSPATSLGAGVGAGGGLLGCCPGPFGEESGQGGPP